MMSASGNGNLSRLAKRCRHSMLALALAALPAVLLVGCASDGARPPQPIQTQRDKPEKAKPNFKEAAKINSELGMNYARLGNYDIAQQKFERALEQDEDHAPAYLGLAFLYAQRQDAVLADQHYQKALRLEPDDANTQNNYAIFLCGQERYEQAEELFLKAARNRQYRQRHSAYANAGVCARRIPDLEKAERYFLEALQLMPRFPEALQQLAGVYLERSEYRKSRDFLRRYEELGPPTAVTLWIGAKVEFALGDELAASRYARKLREQFPDSRESKSFSSAS